MHVFRLHIITRLCLVMTIMIALPRAHARADAETVRPTLTVVAAGDIMMGTDYPTDEYLPPDDGRYLFEGVRHILTSGDITFGNLEGALIDGGVCIKACKDPKTCYAFRMPARYINHLTEAGFTLLSIANNHIGDFGLPGRDSTFRLLKNAGIRFAGIDSRPYCLFTVKGLDIGFAAFAPNVGTPDLRDTDAAADLIRRLDAVCDLVIVSFHGGAEGADNRHVTREDEMFYGENRGNVYAFAHRMIDAGADLVLGHGPHVTRAVERYKDRFIAYSLGNFCTYGRFNLSGSNGVAPLLALTLSADGRFLEGRVHSIALHYTRGPTVDPEARALFELIELTSADFPETGLSIRETGEITTLP
ncbi:hypothetical protein JCM14469_06520 [Desulfatiferula olefinivorans]